MTEQKLLSQKLRLYFGFPSRELDKLLVELEGLERDMAARGERYQHYKGDFYEYVCTAKLELTGEEYAVYESEGTGEVWTRPLKEFDEIFQDEEGTSFARFLQVS